jgi:hypothetical protein
MIPVNQTRFGGPAGGNCLGACLASILEVSLADIDADDLYESAAAMWSALARVCAGHGFRPFSYHVGGGESPPIAPQGYHIACNASHAVVALDGVIVHDPHFKRRGLEQITEWILLIPVMPATITLSRAQRIDIARSWCPVDSTSASAIARGLLNELAGGASEEDSWKLSGESR